MDLSLIIKHYTFNSLTFKTLYNQNLNFLFPGCIYGRKEAKIMSMEPFIATIDHSGVYCHLLHLNLTQLLIFTQFQVRFI